MSKTFEATDVDEINVIVHYQDRTESRVFKGFEPVKDVLAWAIETFQIDRVMATELVLVRYGSKEELTVRQPIAKYFKGEKNLELELARGDITNGKSDGY